MHPHVTHDWVVKAGLSPSFARVARESDEIDHSALGWLPADSKGVIIQSDARLIVVQQAGPHWIGDAIGIMCGAVAVLHPRQEQEQPNGH